MQTNHVTSYTVELTDVEAMAINNEVDNLYNLLIKNNINPDIIPTILRLKDAIVNEMQ